jgi:hypothetical protein
MSHASPPSLIAHLLLRRCCLRGLSEDVDVYDQFANLTLQTLDLLVFASLIVQRSTAQGVLSAAEEPLLPLLNLGDGQTMPAG